MIGWPATLRLLIAQVATLAATVWAAQVPILTLLSLNVTFPVGDPLPGAVTLIVAVNVTDWPNTDGIPDVPSATVVSALLTVCAVAGDEAALALKLPSP